MKPEKGPLLLVASIKLISPKLGSFVRDLAQQAEEVQESVVIFMKCSPEANTPND